MVTAIPATGRALVRLTLAVAALGIALPIQAGSKLLGTGGTSSIEGSAGGGIVPWATIAGYASSDEWSATAGYNRDLVDDFQLTTHSAAVSYDNHYELSLARQQFWIAPLQLSLEQQIIGVKVKVAGDLLYSDLPQLSVGAQFKHQQRFEVPQAVGALRQNGIDWYASVSKVYLDAIWGRNLLTNATVRLTKANQTGLLGFGSSDATQYQAVAELSAALLVRHDVAIGIEFKQKPNQLAFAREDHWKDLFVGWFINRNVSIVAGYVDLGSIAQLDDQTGFYLAIQGAY